MKICFLLQRRFAYIGQEMAVLLKQKYEINDFCGYVFLRESYEYIKNQPSQFSRLLLDENIHRQYKKERVDWEYIKKLEKEYGLPNLWPYIELDRIIRSNQLVRAYPHDSPSYSHEEMARIIQVTAKAIIKFLDKEKPDVVIFSAIGAIGSLLLYNIAKKKNIKTLVIHNSRVGIKYNLSDNYKNFSYVNGIFKKLQANEISLPKHKAAALASLKKFQDNPKPNRSVDEPEFHPTNRKRHFSFLLPKKLSWSIYWRIKMIVRYILNPNRSDYSNINPFWEIWDNLKKKIRILIGLNNLYDDVKMKEDFALFPLHLDPEITTLLYAPFYKDQLWLVKQAAQSLPLNFKLYVKEHPAMAGCRKRYFYKELKKIPNVKLIRPGINNLPLIDQAKLIITISGTTGWEAVQLKKPVIVFSDIFYSQLPMVKKCTAIEDLPRLVKEQLNNFKHDESALVNFLTAIYKESIDIDLTQLWQVEGAGQIKTKRDHLLPLVNLIAKKSNLKSI
ncbi:MAG: hypothetical protein WC323_00025 [Patescibacteria group bacterium]